MIDFPPPLLPPPLVAQNDTAHKDLGEKAQHKAEKSLVNSQLSMLQDPPLPPPLAVAQIDTVRKAAEEKIEHTAEKSLVNSQLSMLQDQLQPSNTRLADKLYSVKITKNELSNTSYQTTSQGLNWLKLSCSQCSNNKSDLGGKEFVFKGSTLTQSLSSTSSSHTSSNSGIRWITLPNRLNREEGEKNESSWIDPFGKSVSSQSSPKYPKWILLSEDQQPKQRNQLSWSLVNPSDILVADDFGNKSTTLIPALESVNRSIAFSTSNVGPDIGFLVPPGFRWTPNVTFDSSIRGWNRRSKGEKFLAWNNGDAVGQFYLQPFHGQKWSLGANLGIRSVYQGDRFAGGSSNIGEGVSAGFRFDYALSDTAGIAIGAEQLVHFDGLTDTGRDIYLVASKGWWLGGEAGDFPLATATAGIGTGYLGRNPNLQFGCSDFIDAGIAQAGNDTFYPLCWGPVASGALVINPRLSLFSEFNNFAFVTGASVAPFEEIPLRATWGVTLAQDFGGGTEEFSFEPDKTRWFFRVSVGL